MNAINWFEIPALDLERAFQFYSTILNNNVRKGTFGNGDLILSSYLLNYYYLIPTIMLMIDQSSK